MKKHFTEIVFILDRSGSMAGLESDTIGGFNSLISKQKKEEGRAFVTTVLFDDRSEVLYDRVPLERIRPMTGDDYYVRGCTALLDALGETIERIATIHRYAHEEDRPDKTLFIITTDGKENASRRYTYERVKQLVEKEKSKYGWEFLFLGANIDALDVAGRMGIGADRAANFHCDEEGTALNFEVITDVIGTIRKHKPLTASWKKRIDADFSQRSR